MKPENLIPSAYEQLLNQYKSGGAPFHISTRPYYSTGAFIFESDGFTVALQGAVRRVLVAREGQELKLFSYGVGDNVDGVQLGDRAATDADTNQAEAQETNDEDFAIEGLSASTVGTRIDYAPVTFDVGFPNLSAAFRAGVADGSIIVEDPASIIVPPEIGSPLTLEEVLFRALAPHVTLRWAWNRKSGDFIGTLDQIPVGGAKSYLKANGEPTHHNFFRLPEGQKWRREGESRDSKLAVLAKLQRDVYVIVAEPGIVTSADPAGNIGSLERVLLDWKLRLHGHAFYLPSENA